MSENNTRSRWWQSKDVLAVIVTILSFAGILTLAIFAIRADGTQAKELFNIALPVFATWVGTVLAFYFSRENFESANSQVRKIVEKLSPADLAKRSISSIMRHVAETTCFRLSPDGAIDGVLLATLIELFERTKLSRLPILSADGKPLYMVHRSSIDKFMAGGGTPGTLGAFIQSCKDLVSLNKGFVVVSEATSIADAKAQMEQCGACQDIFVTRSGRVDEPLLGWVSNVRLAKALSA